ncbi:hypothetical protein GCK72_009894 [Caenorhabditis remanei]|uniref:C-type lectin domain-containing protein n=1 Tax=Caenorhabditis remanei TaxID=31234 RepID=A0A6A5H1P5_CAERE|nr:hypothetical protein GCK72_009894 [Caenorhabditis remanei]KAF1761638.1 hypothetical protein GCK72_009894 [Caenorhabditis remanei]
MQKILLFAFIVAVVADACTLKCPDGFMTFKRTPTCKNSMTSLWCVKTIFPEQLINVTTAKSLCEKEGSVLTTFENDDERLQISSALLAGLASKKQYYGAMILDGHRLSQCQTQDRSILSASPCNSPTTAFTTDDKHTDNTFMFLNWAATEPSASFYEKGVESCVQLGIHPLGDRDKKINDILCDYEKSPLNPAAGYFWNFGVACGRLPDYQ